LTFYLGASRWAGLRWASAFLAEKAKKS